METNFEDDGTLIEKCHAYIELRERLRGDAQTDPTQFPMPTRIAAEMKLTLEDLLELADFADNYLGEFETTHILDRAGAFYDIESGKRIIMPS